VRAFAACSHLDIASEADVTIGTDAVLKVYIVRHVETRDDWAEIEKVQEANILRAVATLSSVFANKLAILIVAIIFVVGKLTNRPMEPIWTLASRNTMNETRRGNEYETMLSNKSQTRMLNSYLPVLIFTLPAVYTKCLTVQV
jgi:hypothetical protein